MKIITGFLTGWRVASKTQPLKAKPLITLLVDRQVASKFLLDTLEGREPLGMALSSVSAGQVMLGNRLKRNFSRSTT